jgi:catechol 2,3-dioxygenase-like lactoylglutathione lyase family enzyme
MVNQFRARLDKIAIVVDDYDQAIEFFTKALGFELAEDSPSLTNDGRPKRWVVVRPPGSSSSPHRTPNPTAASPCSATWRATAGVSSAP